MGSIFLSITFFFASFLPACFAVLSMYVFVNKMNIKDPVVNIKNITIRIILRMRFIIGMYLNLISVQDLLPFVKSDVARKKTNPDKVKNVKQLNNIGILCFLAVMDVMILC